MNGNRCSNVGTMHDAQSGNTSEDESPVPGDYRTGCPEGGVMLEVSWTSDTRVGCVSGVVDLFRTTFVFGINSSGLQQYRTNHRTDGPEGDGPMFGMLEGCGERMGSVFVFVAFF